MSERETWLILGATSSMARAFALLVAAEGADVLLAGRDTEDLARTARDLKTRHAVTAEVVAFDARVPAMHQSLAEITGMREGVINVAIFLGSMPGQAQIDSDPSLAEGIITDNFSGAVSVLHRLAPLLEARGAGTVIGVGSVAGDRGRLKNYVYGAAKAGFHAYLSGLRNRMGRKGVHVVTVKPGFVDTAMTWGEKRMPLVATPEAAAACLLRAARQRQNVVYVPWFWQWIMLVVCAIPERIFKKLSF